MRKEAQSEDERTRGTVKNGEVGLNVGGGGIDGGCNRRLTSDLKLGVNMTRVRSSSKSQYTA